MLQEKFPKRVDFEKEIVAVVQILKREGLKTSGQDYMKFYFPKRKGGKAYLGGAHGLIGVLYMMLVSVSLCEKLKEDDDLMRAIERSVDFVLKQQFESGNFPSVAGKSEDKLVHFCHGAPGAVPMLLSAHKVFGKAEYL